MIVATLSLALAITSLLFSALFLAMRASFRRRAKFHADFADTAKDLWTRSRNQMYFRVLESRSKISGMAALTALVISVNAFAIFLNHVWGFA